MDLGHIKLTVECKANKLERRVAQSDIQPCCSTAWADSGDIKHLSHDGIVGFGLVSGSSQV